VITNLGELSLVAAVPMLATFKTSLDAVTAISLPDLQSQLDGLGNVLAAITVAPPELDDTIAAALATVAQLQAAISGPVVTLQAEAILAKLGDLSVSIGTLTAAAALAIPGGTVSAYVFDGASSVIGVELQAAINGSIPPGHANAVILVATSPADWAALQLVLATS